MTTPHPRPPEHPARRARRIAAGLSAGAFAVAGVVMAVTASASAGDPTATGSDPAQPGTVTPTDPQRSFSRYAQGDDDRFGRFGQYRGGPYGAVPAPQSGAGSGGSTPSGPLTRTRGS